MSSNYSGDKFEMKREYRILNILLAVVLFAAIVVPAFMNVTPVKAQSTCLYGEVIDETGTLNVSEICAKLKPWSAKNIVVLVYLSKDSFSSQDDFYARLDYIEAQVECAPGEPCHQGNQLMPNFVAFEATSDGEWGEITVNDGIKNSPMEPGRDAMKLLLKKGMKAGQPNETFVTVLDQGYAAAFPPPGPQQSYPTNVPPTAAPTTVPVDWTPVKQAAPVFGLIFLLIVLAVVGGWIYVVAIVPAMAMNKQISRVTDVLNRWIIAAEAFFGKEGVSAENSHLYINFKIAGVQAYNKIDKQVLAWISDCLEAFRYLRENLNHLVTKDTPEIKAMTLSQRAKEFEILWLTFAGTSKLVVNLTDADIKQMFEPLMDMPQQGNMSDLVSQLKDQSSRLKSGPLKVDLMYAKVSDVRSADGILGLIMKLKDQLEELRKAADESGPAVKKAVSAKQETSSHPFPDGLTADQALTQVDALIESAQSDLEKRLYITALRKGLDAFEMITMLEAARSELVKAEAALKSLSAGYKPEASDPTPQDIARTPKTFWNRALSSMKAGEYDKALQFGQDLQAAVAQVIRLMPIYREALQLYAERLVAVKKISAVGFRLPGLSAGMKAVDQDVTDFAASISAGDYGKAENLVKEIDADSGVILSEAQSLVKIREANVNAIKKLSVEVARVSKLATETQQDWEALQKYPKGNWLDMSRYLVDTKAILARLFNDPSNAEDTASRIERMNDFEEQAFKKAEAELLEAFELLRQAEKQLKAISERLVTVLNAEKNSAEALAVVKKSYEILVAKRDQFNKLIGKEVDEAIALVRELITDASDQIARREYLAAQQNIIKAREAINSATASASSQVDKLTRLIRESNALKQAMSEAVRVSGRMYTEAIAASRTEDASQMVAQADESYRLAMRREAAAQSLEDEPYAKALQAFNTAMNNSIASAKSASERVKQDTAKYLHRYDEVSELVADVAKLVSQAKKKVKHSDVGRHAESAAERAQSLLPDMPAKGATYAELSRVLKAAESARSEAEDAIKRANKDIEEAEEANSYNAPSVITFNNDYGSPLSMSNTHRSDSSSYTPMSSVNRSSTPTFSSVNRSSTPTFSSVNRSSTPNMSKVNR